MLEQLFLAEMPRYLSSFTIQRFSNPNCMFWGASCQWIDANGNRCIATHNDETLREALNGMKAKHAEMTARPDYAAAEFGQCFGEIAT